MAQNHIQKGAVMPYENTTEQDIASGSGVVVGALFGVALGDIPAGGCGQVALEEVFELPKADAVGMTQGADLYWDATAGVVTTETTGTHPCGVAFAAADAADDTVRVKINA
jgi:predicted RecA/RadA family phage recombinase